MWASIPPTRAFCKGVGTPRFAAKKTRRYPEESSPVQSSKRDASQQPVGQSQLVLSRDCPLSPWAELYCPLSLHRAFCEGKGTQPAGERGRFSPPAIREPASSFCPVPGAPIDVPKLKTPARLLFLQLIYTIYTLGYLDADRAAQDPPGKSHTGARLMGTARQCCLGGGGLKTVVCMQK